MSLHAPEMDMLIVHVKQKQSIISENITTIQ